MSVVQSLVRRGVTYYTETEMPLEDTPKYEMPTWGAVLLALTVAVFLGAMFMVEYTFGRLLPTLAMIESPSEAIGFEPLAHDDPDYKDPEQVHATLETITSSFRRTLRHLSTIGGFRARFRGVSVFIVNAMIVQWVAGMFAVLPVLRFLPRPVTTVLASVACANLSLLWTLVVISEPSPKTWFRRIPSLKMWKKVAGPTAMFSVAEQFAVFAPVYLGIIFGLGDKTAHEIAGLSAHKQTIMALKGIAVAILGFVLAVFLVIPANVTLTRVQASLLPDAEETIVPFDRSFGGKVIPEIVGGTGIVSMTDAWKTFDWAAKIRLAKAYIKVFFLQMALSFLFVVVLLAETFMMVGSDFSKLIPSDGDNGKQGL